MFLGCVGVTETDSRAVRIHFSNWLLKGGCSDLVSVSNYLAGLPVKQVARHLFPPRLSCFQQVGSSCLPSLDVTRLTPSDEEECGIVELNMCIISMIQRKAVVRHQSYRTQIRGELVSVMGYLNRFPEN